MQGQMSLHLMSEGLSFTFKVQGKYISSNDKQY